MINIFEDRFKSEIRMFGITNAELDADIEKAKAMGSLKMYAMGLLSDTQEMLMTNTDANAARQMMNRVKYIMQQHLRDA